MPKALQDELRALPGNDVRMLVICLLGAALACWKCRQSAGFVLITPLRSVSRSVAWTVAWVSRSGPAYRMEPSCVLTARGSTVAWACTLALFDP